MRAFIGFGVDPVLFYFDTTVTDVVFRYFIRDFTGLWLCGNNSHGNEMVSTKKKGSDHRTGSYADGGGAFDLVASGQNVAGKSRYPGSFWSVWYFCSLVNYSCSVRDYSSREQFKKAGYTPAGPCFCRSKLGPAAAQSNFYLPMADRRNYSWGWPYVCRAVGSACFHRLSRNMGLPAGLPFFRNEHYWQGGWWFSLRQDWLVAQRQIGPTITGGIYSSTAGRQGKCCACDNYIDHGRLLRGALRCISHSVGETVWFGELWFHLWNAIDGCRCSWICWTLGCGCSGRLQRQLQLCF